MPDTRDDVLALFDFAWARLRHRLIGLTDDEWAWLPTDDPRVGVRWRLDHLASTLREDRNANRLGRAPGARDVSPPTTATEAVAQLEAAYAEWRSHLIGVDDADLARPVGPLDGLSAGSSRLAFVLHIADELIHHGAEAGVLRDLFGASVRAGSRQDRGSTAQRRGRLSP